MSKVEPFKPHSLSIRELFGNADSFYRIPRYQRPYKWTAEEVERLWDDIYDAWANEKANYFLGSIITARPKDQAGAYLDVVDGQQRLTTLIILFCVLRDLYPEINAERTSEDPFAVDGGTIADSIVKSGKIARLKLVTHGQHQSDFETLILNGITTNHQKPLKKNLKEEQQPKYKFLNSSAIFKEKLEALGQEQAGSLVNYLFDHVHLIRIDCQDREFAIRLFQVLNDRGLDLTAADLIKSQLIERIHTIYQLDPDVLAKQEEQFILDWVELERVSGSVQLGLDDLFILYEYYCLAANPKRSLLDELTEILDGQDPNRAAADLKAFAKNYAEVVYESSDPSVYGLWYLRWSTHWKSILLTAKHSGWTDLAGLAKLLVRFYYLYWIAGRTLSSVKQTSFNLIKWIKEGKDIDALKAEVEAKLIADRVPALVRESLNSTDIASEPWCKPLLLLLEYKSTDASSPAYIELSRDLHLEHVLPVQWVKFKEWAHITKEVSAQWLNSVGNLTLLSGSKNIEASNNPFVTKMEVYKGKGKYGDKAAGITSFQITQRIVNDQAIGAFGGEWSVEAIKARRDWFMGEVEALRGSNSMKVTSDSATTATVSD
jgi:uncharacterized protein with ParB-like and HNH nuclease domain